MTPTPVRSLGTRQDEGWTLLRDVGSDYRDGAEERVHEILMGAADLSSDSDELVAVAQTWAERYHLDPDRANVLRGLAIPPGARVLEIGAGCGAVTRYLGEVAAVVDAVEPVPARARAAWARTRDLTGVEVFVGEIADVPAEPTYDLVVVVGVLEYVGSGAADHAPYLEFLSAIEERLVDGGTLALAIENPLGVKYLAGAPEDHTNRVFDSLEDYPYGGHARTFPRRELEGLMSDAALVPRTLGVFPDYKMTRVVLDPVALGAQPEGPIAELPTFPSPDHLTQRVPLVDEGSLWRSVCRAGIAAEMPNSFLVLAGKGRASQVWPEDQGAVFHSVGRRAGFRVDSVVRTGAEWRVERRVRHPHLVDGPGVQDCDEPVAPGRDLVGWAAAVGDDELAPVLVEWVDHVRSVAEREGAVSLDHVPHNLVVAPGGTVTYIDQEWAPAAMAGVVIDRGLLWLAQRVAMRTSPVRWPVGTVRELAEHLHLLAGLPEDRGWLERAVEAEAALQAEVLVGAAGADEGAHRKARRADLVTALDRPLETLPLGRRAPEQLDRLTGEVDVLTGRVDDLTARLAALTALANARAAADDARIHELQGAYGEVLASSAWRITAPLRWVVGRLAPAGGRVRTIVRRRAGRRQGHPS